MAPIFESAEAHSLAAVFAQRLFYFRRGAEAEAERSGGGAEWCGDGWDWDRMGTGKGCVGMQAAARAGRVAPRAVGGCPWVTVAQLWVPEK